jgi:tetratricopeptide (TPR) repeat protein
MDGVAAPCDTAFMLGGDETRSLDDESGARPPVPSTPGAEQLAPPAVEPGDCLGRYTVRARIGAGGMGEVFAAHDPELDRPVALKIVKPAMGGGSPEARARFLREAQAMARLNHPNVVSVFDVSSVGERVFVAMELVEGPTLADWLADGPRPWRDVVRVFLEAGRGLEAAHAAGVVHRDFKPSNVILGKRVRVVDFGLARGLYAPSPSSAPTVLEGVVTQTGGALGTPAYMAPEQRQGAPASPLSDQYSFAVALHEALFGARPGATPATARTVPRPLRAVVQRALLPRPEDRYPSMRALLDVLGRDPAQARRRWLVAAAVAAIVPTGLVMRCELTPPSCADARPRLAGVWDDKAREAVRAAFMATKLPFAEETWQRVGVRLDDYAARWVGMADEACRATRVEGRQSDQLLDLRMACLERRRTTLGALTAEWSRGVDAEALGNAIRAVAVLPSLDECADTSALTERMPLPKDAAARARIDAVRAELDRARALGQAKHMQEARNAAVEARGHADATGFVPVQAEAAFVLGGLIHDFGEAGAVAPLGDAVRLAEQARDDRLAAEAAVELTGAQADGGLAPSAIQLAPVAEALVLRAGDRPQLRGALLHWRGTALSNLGKYAEALTVLTEARSVLTRAVGANDPLTLDTGYKLMRVLEGQDDKAAALAMAKETLAAMRDALGADHPETGVVLGRLGAYTWSSSDVAAGRQMIERSIAIAEGAFGPSSLRTAVAVNMLANLEADQGHLAEAQRQYERVLAIRRQLLAPDNPLVAHALANLGNITRLQGRLDEAQTQISTALAIMQKNYGPVHPDVAYEQSLLADVLADKGDLDGARKHSQLAVDNYAQLGGPTGGGTGWTTVMLASVDVRLGRCADTRRLLEPRLPALEAGEPGWFAHALVLLARCDLQLGAPVEAARRLERALAIFEKGPALATTLASRGSVRFELARARVASGSDGARAQAVARQAEEELAQAGPYGARELVRVRGWLRRFRSSTR